MECSNLLLEAIELARLDRKEWLRSLVSFFRLLVLVLRLYFSFVREFDRYLLLEALS